MYRVLALLAAGVVLSASVLISAQSTTSSSTTTPTTKKPAATAKPATTVKPVTTITKPATTPAAGAAPAATAGPTAGQVVKPAAMVQPTQATQSKVTQPQVTQPAAVAAPAPAGSAPVGNAAGLGSNYAGGSSGGARAPISGFGVGTILWPGGWTLTSYGCFRTDTRLFCDFDTSNNTGNVQANAAYIWAGAGGVNLVDDGGKITVRHNAFFVGTDGSQFQTAYISQQPVRFVIEYDDVNPSFTSVSLVLANQRIQGVPVRAIDPNQQAGTIPARVAAPGQAGTAGAPAATTAAKGDTLDKTQQQVDAANAKKKKITDILNSVTK